MLEAAIDVGAANDQRMHAYTHKWNKHLSARHLSDTEQGITAAFPEVTGDGAMPYHDCRTAGCRRQAPGPFPPSVCGIRELHCCVHCYDTNGTRHSRECETYTADSTTVSSQEGEDLQVLDTHLEHVYTYEKMALLARPAVHQQLILILTLRLSIDDNDGDNVHQSSTSGGAPATRMYGGFGPEPEGGNPDDVFIDDGND